MKRRQQEERDAPHISRRHFLVAGAGGLTLGVVIPALPGVRGVLAGATPAGAATAPGVPGANVNAYVHVDTDNSVTLMYGGCEFGQGAMTGLAQILAEELRVPWKAIKVRQSLADPVVSYITGGSTAVREQFAPVATAGAAAREMLITAGAQTLNVPRSACVASNGAVVATGTQKSIPYGKIAALAATVSVPTNPPLTDPTKYKVIGHSIPRLDVPSKVNGSAVYGLDVRVPWHGVRGDQTRSGVRRDARRHASRTVGCTRRRARRCVGVPRRDHQRRHERRRRRRHQHVGRHRRLAAAPSPLEHPVERRATRTPPRSAHRRKRSWPTDRQSWARRRRVTSTPPSLSRHRRSTRPTTCRTCRTFAWRC